MLCISLLFTAVGLWPEISIDISCCVLGFPLLFHRRSQRTPLEMFGAWMRRTTLHIYRHGFNGKIEEQLENFTL